MVYGTDNREGWMGSERGNDTSCVACGAGLAAGAVICRQCGSLQPRQAPVSEVRVDTKGRERSHLWVLPVALGVVILLGLGGVLLTGPGNAKQAPIRRAVNGDGRQVRGYLKAVQERVLVPSARADTVIVGGVVAMRAGHGRPAARDFKTAEYLYSAALSALARLSPTESYLRYHDDLLQGLTYDLQSALAYNRWAASHSQREFQRAARLGRVAVTYLTRASQDAPSS